MPKVSTNISLDPQLKASAQHLFSDLGMDLTTAVTIFLKQAVREQRIPFEVRRTCPNAETLEALDELHEMKTNPEKYQRYPNFRALRDEVINDA